MIASFPWYSFRGVDKYYEVFWEHLRDALRVRLKTLDIPDKLSPAADYRTHWASRNLLLSQCCGYHIATKVQKLEVVAAPDFQLNGISSGEYKSLLIVRRGDKRNALIRFKNGKVAYNEDQSYSGHTALLCEFPKHLRRHDFFEKWVPTGSHIESMRAVADGSADIAAIDAISFLFIVNENKEELRKLKKELRIIKHTEKVQAPPFVTSSFRPAEEIEVIRDTLITLSIDPKMTEVLNAMRMHRIVDATNEDYLSMAEVISDVRDIEIIGRR